MYVFTGLRCLLHLHHSLFLIHFTLSSILSFSSSLPPKIMSSMFFLVRTQKASKNLNLVSHFHWKHFHRCYFLFPCFFSVLSVLFPFLSLLIKRILLSWELIKMFLPTLTSLKNVHTSKIKSQIYLMQMMLKCEFWKKKSSFFKIGLLNPIPDQLRWSSPLS